MRKRSDGFTLVELMVVVLVIGILVAIAVPVFNAAKADAQRSTCFANQRTVESAIQQMSATQPDVVMNLPNLVSYGYLKTKPICPSWVDLNNYYYYTQSEFCAARGWIAASNRYETRFGCTIHGHYIKGGL